MPRSCFEFCRISGSQEASTRSHPEPSIDKVSLRLVWDSIASLKVFAKEMQFSLNTLWLFDRRFTLTPGMQVNCKPLPVILAGVTLQGFVLGKLDLLTVSPGKLKFASVTDFSLSKLPRENFIVWGLKNAREQKNVLWISLDNYPKAEKGKNQIPE